MGQYYKTIIVSEVVDNEKYIVSVDNDCSFPDWVGLKLMEHSYLNNEWTDSIAKVIYRQKVRMAHVGDYAYEYPQYELAYNDHVETKPLDVSENYDENNKLIRFNYDGKYLVNWDKKVYINFDNYKPKSIVSWADDVYVCPFTLLTALGNNRGGGDYYENHPHFEDVGSWACDVISIEDEAPEGFLEEDIYFKE